MRRSTLAAILILILAGVPMTSSADSHGSDSVANALMEADRAFAAEVAEGGADAWASWFSPNGIQLPNSGRLIGHEAIRNHMQPFFATGVRLHWEPDTAAAAASGDLGYTIGTWDIIDPKGEIAASGNYVTIWTKTDEGWRVAVDIGNDK